MTHKITKLTKTCEAIPAVWDARDSTGQRWYIRYRHGCLSVVPIRPDGEAPLSLVSPYGFNWKHPTDRLDGCMELWELKVILEPFARITCDED